VAARCGLADRIGKASGERETTGQASGDGLERKRKAIAQGEEMSVLPLALISFLFN
jgi:hypothetical protein